MRSALLLFLLLLCACSRELQSGVFRFTHSEGGGVRIHNTTGQTIVEIRTVTVRRFTPQVKMLFGFFTFDREAVQEQVLQVEVGANELLLSAAEQPVGTIQIEPSAKGTSVALKVHLQGVAEAVSVDFACHPRDRFWGFGAQYNFVDGRGQKIPIWSQEQGVGRQPGGSSPPIGDYTNSYYPVGWMMDPQAGYGLLIEDSDYTEFDLCFNNPERWSVEVWNDTPALRLYSAATPSALLEAMTADMGRLTAPVPDWALAGVWLAAQGGRSAVEARLDKALAHDIPVSALWVQDWLGLRDFGGENFGVQYRWIPDRTLYPDLETMIAGFNARGVRFLGYMNPFIVPDFEHYTVAAQQGYLIHHADGSPYTFPIVTFEGSLLDVTNSQAVAWFQEFARQAAGYGIQGWMADFGEWLPFDAKIADGDAAAVHNLYPALWHGINRQVLEEKWSEDWVMLTRSGFTGEQKIAQVVWIGDQEADWLDSDGLPTAVRGVLTLGLSGIPLVTLDIGGFSGGPREGELFRRWTELGTFVPVMRTHDGLKKKQNHHFDSTPETLLHFSYMARIHAALLPYWKELVADARTTGLPVVRHTVLVDPDWSESYSAHNQWMIGSDMLFAPVVTQGAKTVLVQIPAGNWEHLLTGTAYSGRQIITVDAPEGIPAVLVRRGWKPQLVTQIRGLK